MKRKYLYIALIFAALSAAYAFYMYNKPVESLKSEKPAFSMSASQLLEDYEQNENDANTKYLDKVIEVKGEIDKIENANGKTSIYLATDNMMSSVICELDNAENLTVEKGDIITVKGLCSGYLMDVVLVRSLII